MATVYNPEIIGNIFPEGIVVNEDVVGTIIFDTHTGRKVHIDTMSFLKGCKNEKQLSKAWDIHREMIIHQVKKLMAIREKQESNLNEGRK